MSKDLPCSFLLHALMTSVLALALLATVFIIGALLFYFFQREVCPLKKDTSIIARCARSSLCEKQREEPYDPVLITLSLLVVSGHFALQA